MFVVTTLIFAVLIVVVRLSPSYSEGLDCRCRQGRSCHDVAYGVGQVGASRRSGSVQLGDHGVADGGITAGSIRYCAADCFGLGQFGPYGFRIVAEDAEQVTHDGSFLSNRSQRDFTIRKEVLRESEDASDSEVNRVDNADVFS